MSTGTTTTTQLSSSGPSLHHPCVCDKRHRRDTDRDMSRQICVPSHLLHVTRNNCTGEPTNIGSGHCLIFVVIFAKGNRMFVVYNFNFMENKGDAKVAMILSLLELFCCNQKFIRNEFGVGNNKQLKLSKSN